MAVNSNSLKVSRKTKVGPFYREANLARWRIYEDHDWELGEPYVLFNKQVDRGHYRILDGGNLIGGFEVFWWHFNHLEAANWFVTGVWIAEKYRRQGWWSRAWNLLIRQFPGIVPEEPILTEAMERFLEPWLDYWRASLNLFKDFYEEQAPLDK
jgi:hypothetical protein